MDTAYSMDCVDHNSYIYISLHGTIRKKVSLEFFDRLLNTLGEFRQTRVLVDATNATVETSIVNAFSCAEKVFRTTPRRRVALLLNPTQQSFGENNELVYGNRGLSMQYFLESENALFWLNHGN
jgi:hypothetical protein